MLESIKKYIYMYLYCYGDKPTPTTVTEILNHLFFLSGNGTRKHHNKYFSMYFYFEDYKKHIVFTFTNDAKYNNDQLENSFELGDFGKLFDTVIAPTVERMYPDLVNANMISRKFWDELNAKTFKQHESSPVLALYGAESLMHLTYGFGYHLGLDRRFMAIFNHFENLESVVDELHLLKFFINFCKSQMDVFKTLTEESIIYQDVHKLDIGYRINGLSQHVSALEEKYKNVLT